MVSLSCGILKIQQTAEYHTNVADSQTETEDKPESPLGWGRRGAAAGLGEDGAKL